MKIFDGFLIIIISVLLFMVPITDAIYDFRTDLKTNRFNVSTPVGTTNTTVSLTTAIYNGDSSTLSVSSDNFYDIPIFYSYNSVTRATIFTGLADNTTRTLSASYDVDALNGSSAWNTFLDKVPLIYLCLIFAFPLVALVRIIWS